MENEIQVVENKQVATTDYKEVAIDFLRGTGTKLPAKYESQFIGLCQACGLNPFKRECYAVGYGEHWNIITGYEVYIKRAERTGKLDGWNCKIDGTGDDLKAVITIYRKDWREPFTHYVLYKEAVQRKNDGSVTSIWAKMPSFMLRKVAIAQGFRLCFPDELGGMPYTADEMPQFEEKNITNTADAIVYSDDIPETATEKTVKNEDAFYEGASDAFDATPKETPRQKLGRILREYEKPLGQNYDKASEVLMNGTEQEIESMIFRCEKYLSAKGFKVA